MTIDILAEFAPNVENIADLNKTIKKQGYEVCREKLSVNWKNKALLRHSFGYIAMLPKAQMGRRSLENFEDKFVVNGFILCTMDMDAKFAWIELVCRKETSKIGKMLIEIAEEKARNEGMKLIQLYSLPEERLKSWYKKLGYAVKEAEFFGSKPKAFLMTKLLV